jgi:hypothetical protein
MVIQLSNPVEYTGEGVADRGSLDEKGIWPTGAESGPRAYQRVWLIDNDHKEDEEENASEEGSDEGTPDASTAAKQDGRPQRPSGPGHGDNSGDGAGALDDTQGPLAEADGIGHHWTATRKEAEVAEAEEGFPTAGETAPEMVHTVNMVLRNVRDQDLMEIEASGMGPCHEECFLRRWSNVEYNRHAGARQNTFDGIFEGADLLIANATPSGTAESERDEQAAAPGADPSPDAGGGRSSAQAGRGQLPVPGAKQKQDREAGHRLVPHEHARGNGRFGTRREQMDPPLPVASKRGDQQSKGPCKHWRGPA